jgi:hypothetical protein
MLSRRRCGTQKDEPREFWGGSLGGRSRQAWVTFAAHLLYSGTVSPRSPLAVAAALFLASCAHVAPHFDLRVDPTAVGLDTRRAAAVATYNDLADRVQAVTAHYHQMVRVNHGKLRGMSVLSALSAAAAAALVPATIHPDQSDSARRVLGTFGVSLGANAAIFGLVPHAHQYFLKEVGYQRKAEGLRDAYLDVGERCGPTVLADPGSVPEVLDSCVTEMRRTLDEALRFDPDSPCKPPTEADLDALLARPQGSGR